MTQNSNWKNLCCGAQQSPHQILTTILVFPSLLFIIFFSQTTIQQRCFSAYCAGWHVQPHTLCTHTRCGNSQHCTPLTNAPIPAHSGLHALQDYLTPSYDLKLCSFLGSLPLHISLILDKENTVKNFQNWIRWKWINKKWQI